MQAKHIEHLGCPWLQRYASAAYASENIARLLTGPLGFGSPEIRRLFRVRSGFAVRTPIDGVPRPISSADAKLVGAVLGKLAQRGSPSRCSLAVERHILREAWDTGVLDFEERRDSGEFRFFCQEQLEDLDLMIKGCLLPELLVDDGRHRRPPRVLHIPLH